MFNRINIWAKPIWDQSSTVARCTVLLKVIISIGNIIAINECTWTAMMLRKFVLFRVVSIDMKGPSIPEKIFHAHHNSTATRLKNYLAEEIHEFMLFVSHSGCAICVIEQEMRFIRPCYSFLVLKWINFIIPGHKQALFPIFLRYQRHFWWWSMIFSKSL